MGKHQRNGVEWQQGATTTTQRNGAHAQSTMTRPPCLARLRVRRFLGQKPLPPAARSTPFLCSCAKKRAFGCRHGSCSVPPASPTNAKPQHPSRLRQADLSAQSTPQAPPQVGRGTYSPQSSSAHADGGAAKVKKALFFGGSTPFLWASTKEMGSKGRTGQRPPPNVSAHPHQAKE